MFSLQLAHNQVTITAGDYFPLDFTTLYAVNDCCTQIKAW